MPKLKKIDTDAILDRLEETEESGEVVEWSPSLSKTQQKLFDSRANYLLSYGERGTGKTFCLGGHKLVRHLYENFNAMALIIVGIKSQATMGGCWHKLQTEVLPEWKDGLGLDFTHERQDAQKNLYIDVENRYGKYSRVVLISAPYSNFVRDRIKGFEPSYVFVDELTNLDGPAYFTAVVQQLGRRQGIRGVQQYTAACNPAGPSHWVYKRFFQMPYDKDGNWNDDYFVAHLPIEENRMNLPDGYYDRVMEAVADDPIEEARMVRGEWIDRPSGQAIFGPYWNDSVHMVGDARKGIVPNTRFPVLVGWDPGSVNNAVLFMQCLVGKDGVMWTCFDEYVTVSQHIPYTTMIPMLYRKMRKWNNITGHDFNYIHISDNSAFNQYRAARGSYDVRDIEDISRKSCDNFEMDPIRMKAAPKFAGSVEARVKLMIARLQNDEFRLSTQCPNVKKMFHNLISDKVEKYEPNLPYKPKRSVYIHAFDALTYPILYFDAGVGTPMQNKGSVTIRDIGA